MHMFTFVKEFDVIDRKYSVKDSQLITWTTLDDIYKAIPNISNISPVQETQLRSSDMLFVCYCVYDLELNGPNEPCSIRIATSIRELGEICYNDYLET